MERRTKEETTKPQVGQTLTSNETARREQFNKQNDKQFSVKQNICNNIVKITRRKPNKSFKYNKSQEVNQIKVANKQISL